MAFSSASIENMPGLTRFKASSFSQADNTTAATWTSTGDTIRVGTATGAPKWRDGTTRNVVNGKPYITFASGTGDLYTLNSVLNLSDFTIFIVHQTSGDCCFLSHNSNNIQLRIGVAAANQLFFFDGPSDTSGGSGVSSTTLGVARSAWNVGEYRRKNALLAFQDAGTARGHGQWSVAASDISVFNQIGSLSGSAFLNGDVAEILIFSRTLSVTEEANVLDYFKNEYNITPSIVPTSLLHQNRGIPKIYGTFQFQNAANMDFIGLTINKTNVWSFSSSDIASAGAFTTAISTRIPDTAATGFATIDGEGVPVGTSPCYPASATTYKAAAWNTPSTGDCDYLIARHDALRSARPGVSVGEYWPPYIDTVNYVATAGTSLITTYAEAAVNIDYFDAYTTGAVASQNYGGTRSLVAMLAHQQNVQPELYAGKNYNLNQEMMNAWFAANVQLNRDIQDYYTKPSTAQDIMPFLWPQHVPGGVGQPIPSFTNATWTLASKTLTKVGAFANLTLTGNTLFDRVYISGGTGAVVGHYIIATKVSNDAITLTTAIGSADATANIAGSSTGVFLSQAFLASQFTALRLSGADGAFLGGDAQTVYYTAAEWQAWNYTILRQSLLNGGMLANVSPYGASRTRCARPGLARWR